jgi:hypothetical protein
VTVPTPGEGFTFSRPGNKFESLSPTSESSANQIFYKSVAQFTRRGGWRVYLELQTIAYRGLI